MDFDEEDEYFQIHNKTPKQVLVLHLEINPNAFPDLNTAKSVKKIVMDNLQTIS